MHDLKGTNAMNKKVSALFAASLLAAPAAVLADHHAEAAAEAPAEAGLSTEKTPLGELIGNADTKAILDAHLPGMSDNPQIAMASSMTLRRVAQFSGGAISDETLDAIDVDLAKLSAK